MSSALLCCCGELCDADSVVRLSLDRVANLLSGILPGGSGILKLPKWSIAADFAMKEVDRILIT